MHAPLRVLGVDPGSRYLGYGVVERRGNDYQHVASGVVNAAGRAPLQDRLHTIFIELGAVMRLYRPQAVAVEGVFTRHNPRSALILGHARGVALLLAAQASVPVFEYAPARVKRAVGAGGNDSKGSVARMVSRQLVLPEGPRRADVFDALAVALCHLHQHGAVRPSGTPGRPAATGSFADRLRPSIIRAAW